MSGIVEYPEMDALDLARLIAQREATALEVLDTAIARVERFNPVLNAITVTLFERAREAAKAPFPAGPFAGVPFLLKDLGAPLAGTSFTGSSKLFANFVPDHDATLVMRYLAAGLNIFGRTTSPEMGLMPSTEPLMFGPCRNPWNLAHSSGGSSDGAAAAVAARILPMAHATDGGGSIRVPASACGLFGMKPTRARTPSGPDVGEGWGAQAVYHCVSRSVRDSAALLDATHGPEPGDPYWAPPPSGPFLAEVGRAPPALRIALCVESWNGQPVDPDCRQAAEDAAKLCETLGHIVSIACPEADFAALRVAQRTIVAAHIQATLRWRAAALGKIPSPEDMEPYTWVVSELADRYTAADYAAAITVLHRAGRAVARFFGGHDILITPTMCSPPVPLGVMSSLNTDNESYLTAVNRAIGFTALFNASGNPAMTLPLHWTASGLPVGVQFVAPFGDEATLFRLAGQIEIACPWKDRRPSLAA